MKGSGSSQSRTRALLWPAGALAVAFVAAHVPFLPQSLEDIDSINFALGLRHFDPALHQPHPPGYPLYIGLGHVSLAVLSWLVPALPALRVEAVALAVWSLAGAVAVGAVAGAATDNMPVGVGGGLIIGLLMAAVAGRRRDRERRGDRK